jgi:two-component system alkaline phosphatase synthesis response regulator PhoP
MKLLILVVDDESTMRRLLRFMLEHAGFTVVEAEDGYSALAQVNDARPDAIILDVMMPSMDGLQTCQILRGQEATADLPVIMLSAKTTPQAIIDGLEAGADEYLTKPVARNVLLETIEKVIPQ